MIKRVVLTGGPGSGKTTVIESIQKNFGSKYKIIIVDETASHLINMGIRPFGESQVPLLDFQELVLREQLTKEDLVNKSLDFIPNDNILIIYDRGILDNCAYISKEEFQEILNRLEEKHTINEFLNRYDLIVNLVSRKDFYTTDNNPARTEAVEEALNLGNKTLQAWLGHNNLKIVLPKDDINEKIKEVLNHINKILEEKQVKSQKKYIVDIDKTNLEYLKSISKIAHLKQTYLESDPSIEKRIREKSFDGNKSYTYTIHKKTKDGLKIKVSEESISKRMYNKLLDFKDNNKETIEKDRYYFSYKDGYFTLDIIDNYGILEINITDEKKIDLPPFIEVIEDVTFNQNFQNINIATKTCKQLTKK